MLSYERFVCNGITNNEDEMADGTAADKTRI